MTTAISSRKVSMQTQTFQKGSALLIVIIVVVVLAVVGGLGFLFWKNFMASKDTSNTKIISSFEECKSAPGSFLLETYPEQCKTTDGQTFTGPSDQVVDPLNSYCAEGEKLCFDYPDNWNVTKEDQSAYEWPDGYTGDMLDITDSTSGLVLHLRSGIGGVGGACDDESKTPVYVLDSTEIPQLTGFKTDYSLDMLRVARVVYPLNDTKTYVAALYVTGDQDYTVEQEISDCGIFMSSIVIGRYARFDGESENPGAFEFVLQNESKYDTVEAATAAYDTDAYKEAATILASLRYE